jgi:hypothetical protein
MQTCFFLFYQERGTGGEFEDIDIGGYQKTLSISQLNQLV